MWVSLQDNCVSGVVSPRLSQVLHALSGHSRGEPSLLGEPLFLISSVVSEKMSLECFHFHPGFTRMDLTAPHSDWQRWLLWSPLRNGLWTDVMMGRVLHLVSSVSYVFTAFRCPV